MSAREELSEILMSDAVMRTSAMGRDYAPVEADAILAAGFHKIQKLLGVTVRRCRWCGEVMAFGAAKEMGAALDHANGDCPIGPVEDLSPAAAAEVTSSPEAMAQVNRLQELSERGVQTLYGAAAERAPHDPE